MKDLSITPSGATIQLGNTFLLFVKYDSPSILEYDPEAEAFAPMENVLQEKDKNVEWAILIDGISCGKREKII